MSYRAVVPAVILLAAVALPALGTDLSVTRVWPEKICVRPGEVAEITVDVANSSDTMQTGAVSLAVKWGLDQRDELPAQTVEVPARGQATLTFACPVPVGRKWGHEAEATLTSPDGQVLGSSREYFAVGDNPWEVGHYLTTFGLRDLKDSGYLDNTLFPRWRQGYVTTVEGFSWQPSVFDEMSPAASTWRSGQGWYREGKQDWQYMIRRAHEQGMAVITYIQSISYGPEGFDFARRHPDWLTYDKDGRPHAWFDVDQLTAARYRPEAQPYDTFGGITTGMFFPANAHVGDYWIEEVLRSVEMFAWDGFRSDGNPGVTSGFDYTGKLHEVENAGRASAEFLRRVMQRITKKHPDFLFGWNNIVGGHPQAYYSEEEQEVMLPGAYNLWENFSSASHPSSPYHPWKQMAFYLQQETAPIREGGGFAHAGWMGSNRYLEAVASACGNHIDGWGDAGFANYRRFEFRWSEFIWDNNLRYVRPGAEAVQVSGPERVWWEDFVHARDLPGGGRRVIVHLINMPETDDEAWADRPPAPAEGVIVRFTVPPGMRLSRSGAMSPDGEGDVLAVQTAADGSLALPPVVLWTLVVAEFEPQ